MPAFRHRREEPDEPALIRAITTAARPVATDQDLDDFLAPVADRRFVFIGEASHGSHEFYALRAALTRRLITEHGFHAVAVEGDWPDAYRVDRYVRGTGADQAAVDALAGFRRFPSWMWRNADVLDFVGWLRDRNDDAAPADRAGFYGLDLYCLRDSAEQVLTYLDQVDPDAAARARERYACFDHGSDAEAFGAEAHLGLRPDCEQELVEQLVELRRRRMAALGAGLDAGDEHFHAEQNARVVSSAARYYRTMFSRRISSWNVRDRHMADTLDALAGHLTGRTGALARIVVWAHNSHVGDARATDMGDEGELTIGQLARERHPGQVALIGMTTHTGTVTAASDWGGPAERKAVRASLAGSSERLFHDCGLAHFGLWLGADGDLRGLGERRLQRAIGVIYRPDTERASHYLHGALAAQYDAVVHLDVTHALEPLERQAPSGDEVAETFPSGI